MIWVCKKCNLTWYHPVDICIYCRSKIEDVKPRSYIVKGITEVFVPSLDHTEVPYYNVLSEDEYGNLHIKKSFKKYEIGDSLSEKKETNKKIVGIIGTGTMGVGIAQIAIQSDCKVILKSRSKKESIKALKKIDDYLLKIVGAEEKNATLKNIKLTTDFKDLSEVDIVIECIVEDIDIKKQLFKKLNNVCNNKTIFATNTSSLSIDELASIISKPHKIIGMHFFNPATKMRLVEIVSGKSTSQETIKSTICLVKQLNKIPVMVKNSPGFIVNRILMPYLNEAMYILEENIAIAEDIDTAAKLGLNHPMGPLALTDLIGLDVCLAIMESMYSTFESPKYKPCSLLIALVGKGHLGRKTGKGFYEYK